ncbi:MAG: hypothetical protein WC461_02725 [Candidatus Paceibacterota bacterium]
MFENRMVAARLFFPRRGLMADVIDKENEFHWKFFGRKFNLRAFSNALANYGESKIAFWAELNLEPHFEPGVMMAEGADFPGWKEKPEASFYSAIQNKRIVEIKVEDGKIFAIFKHELHYTLTGSSILVDAGVSPFIDFGKIKPKLTVHPERFIEANVFPQLYPDMPRSSLNKAIICKEFYLNEENNGNKRIKGRLCIGGESGLTGVRWCRRSPLIRSRPVFVL